MRTKRTLRYPFPRVYTEPPLPAPASVPLSALVSAFTNEIVTLNDQRRGALTEVAEGREEQRETQEALDNTRESLRRMCESARRQGQQEDDERDPDWFYDCELVSFRGALTRLAERMGVSHDYGVEKLLTGDEAETLALRIYERWQRVENAAKRYGWQTEDGWPEEHLDAEVARWRARAFNAEQEFESCPPRPRARAGDVKA